MASYYRWLVFQRKRTSHYKLLANIVDAKDPYTRSHSDHVARVAELIYEKLPKAQKHKICKWRLLEAATLHDIGKIGVPDNILNKVGELTMQERDMLKKHAELGKIILKPTGDDLLGEIVYHHHERVDGEGYFNVKSDCIPIESKIIAVADTLSALCTDRVYRKKKSYDDVMQIVKDAAGTQLDEEIVEILCLIPQEDLLFDNIEKQERDYIVKKELTDVNDYEQLALKMRRLKALRQ